MKAIDQKLVRDLWRLKGQVFTIALVVACGIASYVTLQGTWNSLSYTRDRYYELYRFADVFAHLERAPKRLSATLSDIPGVAQVYTRVVENVLIPVPGEGEPPNGTIVSLPPPGQPLLNDIYLRAGRRTEPGRDHEVVVSEGFAKAHELLPGARIPVVINGTLRQLDVVGLAMSPEFVFPTPPGQFMPDDRRYGILWMNEDALAAAFRVEGAFNDVALRLQPDANVDEVVARIDPILEPYGGLGAYGRKRQLSHFALTGELQQLESMATIIPAIFLGVAAFLLNVVLSRLIYLQRPNIATLKAVGYSNLAVGLHYLKLVTVVVFIGSGLGLGIGAWLGRSLTTLYTDYYRFPILVYQLDFDVLFAGVVVSFAAAVLGAFIAVRGVVRLPPAEAMRPPAPARYHASLLDKLGLPHWIGTAAMMVVREIRRRPLRFVLSAVGIACGIGVMIVGRFSSDSLDYMLDVHLNEQQPAELMVMLNAPVPQRSLQEIEQLPGVLGAEGMRAVPVRLRKGQNWRDTSLLGLGEERNLRRVVTRQSKIVPLPTTGVLLTDVLARVLDIHVGDLVEVELKEGERSHHLVAVAGVIDETFGMQGYMRAHTLQQLLDEEPMINSVFIHVDPRHRRELEAALKELPTVGSVTFKQTVTDLYRQQTGKTMGVFTLILTIFAAIISIGVIYNNARVALSLRSRDLASLRVLGFTRREISAVLLGELALQVLAAIPIGLIFGYRWTLAVAKTIDPETFRLPVTISDQTYAYAITVAIVSGLVSALMVRRKLDKLDLIAVLKTRE